MKNILIFLLLILANCSLKSQTEWKRIINLEGNWKFSVGNNEEWKEIDFNDSRWEEIYVPSAWEDEGFYGHDGYSWYRKEILISSTFEDENLYLNLGRVDDVDEVYFNGELIGFAGSFPPNYKSAYFYNRVYKIPKEIINFDSENLIAVKVYDNELGGGIIEGEIGIVIPQFDFYPVVNLYGKWKFRTGDNLNWKDPNLNDSNWKEILAPALWELYEDEKYDGYGWYRKEFRFDADVTKQFVMILGKIDDLDQTYLNGNLVGQTGKFKNEGDRLNISNEYNKFRIYYLKANDLIKGKNEIAVRVYDGFQDGGIYEGPLGIMTLEKFRRYWEEQQRAKTKKKTFWELFWGN